MMDEQDMRSFRDATNKQKMNGVTVYSFQCAKCKQFRLRAGRKEIVKGYSKAGYMCAHCAAQCVKETAK